MDTNPTHPAHEVARLLNSGTDEISALTRVGLTEDDVMGEDSSLPIGDPDCDVIDFCDGYQLRRPERRNPPEEIFRLWAVHQYERVS